MELGSLPCVWILSPPTIGPTVEESMFFVVPPYCRFPSLYPMLSAHGPQEEQEIKPCPP